MAIKVLAFGQIADLLGKSVLEFSGIKNTDELKTELFKTDPSLKDIQFAIAVDKKMIHENIVLKGNETVALLPAFSGG